MDKIEIEQQYKNVDKWCEENLFGDRFPGFPLTETQQTLKRVFVGVIIKWEKAK